MKIYYMRDNHTFLPLSFDVNTAIIQIKSEFKAGYTCGMVCITGLELPPVHTDYRDLKGSLNRIKEWYAVLSIIQVGAGI